VCTDDSVISRRLMDVVRDLDRPLGASKGKVKVAILVTCYSASYMSSLRDQKRFTISEVAADWHELMIPQRTMRPSIARVSE